MKVGSSLLFMATPVCPAACAILKNTDSPNVDVETALFLVQCQWFLCLRDELLIRDSARF